MVMVVVVLEAEETAGRLQTCLVLDHASSSCSPRNVQATDTAILLQQTCQPYSRSAQADRQTDRQCSAVLVHHTCVTHQSCVPPEEVDVCCEVSRPSRPKCDGVGTGPEGQQGQLLTGGGQRLADQDDVLPAPAAANTHQQQAATTMMALNSHDRCAPSR